MLDYDKKFLLKSWDNLTFDGSSIRGFTAQRESDLRLGIDWSAFYWGPADVFGPGKVLVFGHVIDKDGQPYAGDIRGVLKSFADDLYKKEGYTLNAANEIEGFLFKGPDAERRYHETGKFDYVNTGGYYHSLPGDPLRTFIDTTAEVERAMGFQNEKDHPEVAPSQFEINYGYGGVAFLEHARDLSDRPRGRVAEALEYVEGPDAPRLLERPVQEDRHALARDEEREERHQVRELARPVVGRDDERRHAPRRKA